MAAMMRSAMAVHVELFVSVLINFLKLFFGFLLRTFDWIGAQTSQGDDECN